MKLHDEIKIGRSVIIVDTCEIPKQGLATAYYETIAMRPNGKELDVRGAHAESWARENHELFVRRYKGVAEQTAQKQRDANSTLTGKYAKLRDDLIAAYKETEAEEQTEDGGTCNFDSPMLKLPRWNAAKIEQAAKEAGGNAFKWTCSGTLLGWVFSPRSSGQGNRRTRRAEAMSKALAAKGYDASMYYQMD